MSLPQASARMLCSSLSAQGDRLCFPNFSLLGHTWQILSTCLVHPGPDPDCGQAPSMSTGKHSLTVNHNPSAGDSCSGRPCGLR